MLQGEGNTKPMGRGVPPVIRVEAKEKDKGKAVDARDGAKEAVRPLDTGRPRLSEINARQIDKHLVSLTEPDSYEA